jgi:hypothetical protein
MWGRQRILLGRFFAGTGGFIFARTSFTESGGPSDTKYAEDEIRGVHK